MRQTSTYFTVLRAIRLRTNNVRRLYIELNIMWIKSSFMLCYSISNQKFHRQSILSSLKDSLRNRRNPPLLFSFLQFAVKPIDKKFTRKLSFGRRTRAITSYTVINKLHNTLDGWTVNNPLWIRRRWFNDMFSSLVWKRSSWESHKIQRYEPL